MKRYLFAAALTLTLTAETSIMARPVLLMPDLSPTEYTIVLEALEERAKQLSWPGARDQRLAVLEKIKTYKGLERRCVPPLD